MRELLDDAAWEGTLLLKSESSIRVIVTRSIELGGLEEGRRLVGEYAILRLKTCHGNIVEPFRGPQRIANCLLVVRCDVEDCVG